MKETALKARLRDRIKASGPLSIADYMATCLSDPTHGYYTTQRVFGRQGDFTTAPEVSQMFGELIGAFCLSAYEHMGAPESFNLVECGPGRGTLMADILRTAKLRPAFLSGAHLTFLEISPKLRDQQRKAVRNAHVEPTFVERVDQLPDGPTIVIANEFFDALPIHQFMKSDKGWNERKIGLDEQDNLQFGLGVNELPLDHIPVSLRDSAPGSILETQPAANATAQQIASHLKQHGGVGLFIDYGYAASSTGDTLQALYKHEYDDVLAHPGEADLTAHVNFEALAKACTAAGATVFPMLEQGEFLLRMGLLERAGQLGTGKSHQEQETIRDAVERLAAPDQMGTLFKVLGITGSLDKLPPFDQPTGSKAS